MNFSNCATYESFSYEFMNSYEFFRNPLVWFLHLFAKYSFDNSELKYVWLQVPYNNNINFFSIKNKFV